MIICLEKKSGHESTNLSKNTVCCAGEEHLRISRKCRYVCEDAWAAALAACRFAVRAALQSLRLDDA